ncbi:MAG: tyrosine-protein phosphatase [Phycisphaerae bacterium]
MKAAHRRHRRRVAAVVLTLIVVAGVGTLLAKAWQSRPRRFAVVEDGVLYRSGQPTEHQIDRLMEEIGLRTILVVRKGSSRRVPDEVAFARGRGLNVVQIPVVSREPIPPEQIRQFFECVDDPANRPILIHCAAGRHRTGLLCAAYRIERQGWTIERAIDELQSFGFDEIDHAALLEQLKHYTPVTQGHEVESVGRGNDTQP